MSRSRRQLVLRVVATDNTFERAEVRGTAVWVGKCIHCNAALVVDASGDVAPGVTIEHIVAKNHGGTDALDNLALACQRCNNLKGKRLDHRHGSDPRLQDVNAKLRARRLSRWREHL